LPVARPARVLLALAFVVAAAHTPPATAPAAAASGMKVAIIVGPTGSLTDGYRNRGNQVAEVALAAGATVAKAYSPNATWANVRAAVEGANVIVYFGHGNGFPNPYGSTELQDRHNGWGLNTSTDNGDADSWSAGTLVYCGEKALLGTLGASDGSQQRKYCTGGPIRPAPGFVMVYGQAHYAPGFGERYQKSDPLTTYKQARLRAGNYSFPVLALGGSAFYATAYGDAHRIVQRLLTEEGRTFGWIFKQGVGYDADELVKSSHFQVANAQIWVQRTVISGFHFGQPDYWYAFAGAPGRTWSSAPSSSLETVDTTAPRVRIRSPRPNAGGVKLTADPAATFSEPVSRINTNTVVLVEESTGVQVPGEVRWNSTSYVARFMPFDALKPHTTYRVKLAGRITDAAGNRLGSTSWRFTTGG
jgi:hypothetical protein